MEPRFMRVEHTITWASGESSMRPAVLDRATGMVSRFVTADAADRAWQRLTDHPHMVWVYVWRPVSQDDALNGVGS